MTPTQYLDQLSSLRMDRTKERPRPHKVCLLLAVLDLIRLGTLRDNQIRFDDALRKAFSRRFNQLKQNNDRGNPEFPYFYLQSSGFWYHRPVKGKEEEYQKRVEDHKAPSPRATLKLIDYAWLDTPLFNLLCDSAMQPQIEAALLANLHNRRKHFSHWTDSIGKSERAIKSYAGALNNALPKLLQGKDGLIESFFDVGSVEQYPLLSYCIESQPTFQVKDEMGHGMYSAALRLYGQFLKDATDYALTNDLADLDSDASLSETERSTLRTTRLGHGKFREGLVGYWRGCAVTQYPGVSLLIASHIKSWREADNRERLDPYNGLLLVPNLDKVFDRQLISFDGRGRILISSHLEDPNKLGIHKDMVVKLDDSHQRYLAHHREHYREKQAGRG
ncbi:MULTISPECIES: HNH endonuclease [unclassified Alcanivorax]|jgi:predicted restriction endonuclease|uniref:HNH endonuclease n=1 Tax=Alcanivorax TaxID=59753 RepID=UPI0004B96A54|nr:MULTISPECIES: HNH endonuclease [unclassified Alcanivorax]PKG01227.1 HNH endonuclease [Alcanivorax sp. 97CO-6]